MLNVIPLLASSLGARMWHSVRRESHLSWRFIRRDLTASVIPGALFTLAAVASTGGLSLTTALRALGRSLPYLFLYIYTFCLANQIAGVEEDRINKPDRPIPSGAVTLRGAKRRWAASMVAFPAAGWLLGGPRMVGWALLWQAILLAYNFLGLDRHWIPKNFVFITAGTIALFGASWELAAPLTAEAWRWTLYTACAFGLTLPLQDLRDVEGDRRHDRRTMPMTLGERPARWILAAAIALLPLATHLALMRPAGGGAAVRAWEVLLGAVNLVTAARTVLRRGPAADHRTYMLHTCWLCLIPAAAVAVMQAETLSSPVKDSRRMEVTR